MSAYLWLEGVFVFGTIVLAFLFFARSARPLLRRAEPLLERLKLARILRAFYESIHHYRGTPRLLLAVVAVTFVVQAVRILSIWAAAKAVGIDLDVRVYYVMGPLLFLVMLVPFTLNGFAVREAFFVSFLGSLDVGADEAFAAGFLYFLVTLALSLPGRPRDHVGGAARREAPRDRAWLTTYVAVVVVTYDALPWIEQCLASVAGVRDRRRRQRLAGRDGRARSRAPPGGAGDRGREPRASARAGTSASARRGAATCSS